MAEREAEIEKELERQYGLLTDYDRLLGLTVDPLERERYKYNQQLVQQNIDLLEKGLEGLPGAQVLTAEELLRETVTRKNLKLEGGQPWNFEKLEVGRDVIQTGTNSGIINTGKMGNVNLGSGTQTNIGVQQAHTIYNVGQMVKRERVCPRPNNKPPVFGGRAKELAELKEKLKEGQTPLLAIQGLGGMGKTTLAYQGAYELYKEGVFGSVLSSTLTREPNPLAILTNWAQYGDPDFSPGNLPLQELASRAKALLEDLLAEECQGRVLVVLDDLWENGINTVRLLLEACPGEATILITTRSEDVARSLRARLYRLEELDEEHGKQLLQEYFKGECEEADPTKLGELSRTLGGYPLALSLAAQRVLKRGNRAKVLDQQLAEYQKRLPALKEVGELELDQGDQQEDNLTLVLSYSYEELNEEEKRRFRALGVLAFGQSFDTKMLAALWQSKEAEVDKVEEYADELDRRSLLQASQASGEGWYRQHPLLQSYARALSGHNLAEYQLVLGCYQDYIIALTGQFEKLPPEEWGQLSLYLPHIQVVGDGLVSLLETAGARLNETRLLERAQQFAFNTRSYVLMRQELRREKWLEMGLTTSRQLQAQRREALFLNALGLLYADLGEKEKALEYYHQALPLLKVSGEQIDEAALLNNLALVYRALGETGKALEYYEQALPLLRALGEGSDEATTLNNLGMLYRELGELAKALKYFQEALPVVKAAKNRLIEATILNNLGLVYADLGEKEKALEYYQQVLPLSQALGNQSMEARVLNNIGLVYSESGQKEKALEYYQQALPLLKAVGNKEVEATSLNNVGLVYADLGQLDKAVEYYQQALNIVRVTGNRGIEAGTLNNLGEVYYALGQLDKALAVFEEVLPISKAVGSRKIELITCSNIWVVYYKLGQIEEALHHLERCVELKEQLGYGGVEHDRTNLSALRTLLARQQGAQDKGFGGAD
jgi:tetratricopeptide (TPR) repeat protein